MNHCNTKFSFDDVKPFDKYLVDYEWAKNPKYLGQLARFAKSFYRGGQPEYDDYNIYFNMMNETIKHNNIEGLELLWQAVYCHDRDSPCYEGCLIEASKYADLKTFQHCLYGFGNYASINGTEAVSYSELLENAKNNHEKDVLEYLKRLEPCVIDGELHPLSNCHVWSEDDWDDCNELGKLLVKKQKLYLDLCVYTPNNQ